MIRLWTLGRIGVEDDGGKPVDEVSTQTKRLALLAYLALAEPRGWQRRDTLLALFWPELDARQARHALRQALHFLRTRLGPDAILTRGVEDVAIGPAVWCDAVAFAAAGAVPSEALPLYRGDLLPGFFVRDAAAEFDHWLDGRRAALRTRVEALAAAGSVAGGNGDGGGLGVHASVAVAGRSPSGMPAPLPRSRRRDVALIAAAMLVLVGVAGVQRWVRSGTTTGDRALAVSLYSDGLRALGDRSDRRTALGWFEAALRADPQFALAAFYAGESAAPYDAAVAARWYNLAERLAPRASERDRLYIRASLGLMRGLATTVPIADSLADRYAADAEAQQVVGSVRLWHGDFAGAISAYRRELALAKTTAAGGSCSRCDALSAIAVAFQFTDSLPAAELAARAAVRLVPRSPATWEQLATIESGLGHYRLAAAAERRAAELVPGQPADLLGPASLALHAGDYAAADRALAYATAVGSDDNRRDALWFRVISLRGQGRLAEALAAAQAYRRLGADSVVPRFEAIPEAQVLFEMGRYRQSALLFDSIAAVSSRFAGDNPGAAARARCWAWTHAGEAWAASGDTTRVLALADSIERTAASSLYGRDQHLAAHLRGLVWLARGRGDSAVASLRRAVFSANLGYSRTNLTLARVLLSQGRPAEAAALARSALEGPVDGSSYYSTRTEMRELLARAEDAAGDRAGALTDYRAVVDAWSHADAQFSSRVVFARRRIATLSSVGERPAE